MGGQDGSVRPEPQCPELSAIVPAPLLPLSLRVTARRLAARVRPLLEQRPIEHSLLLTLLAELEAAPDHVRSTPLLCIRVERGGVVVGAGFSDSQSWPLLLSRMPAAAIDALVDLVVTVAPTLAGVNGVEPEPAAFAEAWRRCTGRAVSERRAQWLYQLDRVVPPVGVSGTARVARPDELGELANWAAAEFRVESGPPAVVLRATTRRLFVWEDGGGAVSMARLSSPLAGVARVGLVYTPPVWRRRGYASALVAAVSQLALDEGAHSCVLYTDVTNPTSNALYQAIGYRPRYEAAAYTFAPPSSTTVVETTP
jgi:GNAT superfamily N-acetyltransferase